VDESNYRLTADFHTAHDAGAVVDVLTAVPELSKDDASLSYYPGSTTFFLYAPTADVFEDVARVFRVSVDRSGLRPVSVAAGRWLSDEARWSDETPPGSAADDSGWVGAIIEGLLSWPVY